MNVSPTFEANAKTTEVAKSRMSTFDNPTESAQITAMFFPALGDHRFDAGLRTYPMSVVLVTHSARNQAAGKEPCAQPGCLCPSRIKGYGECNITHNAGWSLSVLSINGTVHVSSVFDPTTDIRSDVPIAGGSSNRCYRSAGNQSIAEFEHQKWYQ